MVGSDWHAQVHPDLRKMLRSAPSLTFGPWTTRGVRLLMSLLRRPRPDRLIFRTAELDHTELHLYLPPEPRGALLWIHGGGRIIGTPAQDAELCARIARDASVVVAAVEYRLAPEHPFPAALDDCAAAWRWLVTHAAELGISTAHLLVGGESAGGGLAAELSHRLHDDGGCQPCGQILVYPMLDDRTATRTDLTAQKHLVWNNTSNLFAWTSYLGMPAGSPQVPPYAAAARRTDLSGLPPAWLTVGTLDLFLDEDRAYVDRLRRTGVRVTPHILDGGFHGYFSMGRDEPPIQDMWQGMLAFIDERLSSDDHTTP